MEIVVLECLSNVLLDMTNLVGAAIRKGSKGKSRLNDASQDEGAIGYARYSQ